MQILPRRIPGRALALAALLAALLVAALGAAASASARTTVKDPKRETRALSNKGRIDIIRATEQRGMGRLVFTVTMREQLRPRHDDERPLILINTRGNRRSDAENLVYGSSVYRARKDEDPVRIGAARLGSKGRTWTYRFDADVIPNLDRFGWAALTSKGRATDIAPSRRYALG